jgi:hypothetical protein
MPDTGWIPPSDRTVEQLDLTKEFHRDAPKYFDVAAPVALPDVALSSLLCLKVTGKGPVRIHQQTGSCVGAGGEKGSFDAAIGDIAVRGDHEDPSVAFWLPTYGVGRQIAGLRGRGDGSFGAAQAKAGKEFGRVIVTDNRAPKPTFKGDWMVYPANTETEWSWPPQFPSKDLAETAGRNRMGAVVQVKTTDEAAALKAQGYGLTIASMFGTAMRPPVKDGVLLASWTDEWAHQMSIDGYAIHASLGRIWKIDNQWHNAHGNCHFYDGLVKSFCEGNGIADPGQLFGSFWITDATFTTILGKRDAECYGHSNTGGFPARTIPWEDWSWA